MPRLRRPALLLALLVAPGAAARAAPVRKWRVLGPFVIGKNELDGEPWHLSNASELLQGGFARSRKLVADDDGVLNVDWPSVEWQSLVNGVGGRELLEWQALARGYFKMSSPGVALVSCQGVSAFQLDGMPAPFVGDQYRAGFPGRAVQLSAGSHRLSVRLRGVVRAQFGCSVEPAGASAVPRLFGEKFLASPDFLEGKLASDLVALPLTNVHPTEWLRKVRPVQIAGAGGGLVLAESQAQAPSLAPGQSFRLAVRVAAAPGLRGCPRNGGRLELAVEAELGEETVRSATTVVRIRCRSRGQSFLFTFLDADGSLQHAAAVAPATGAACASGGCPVLLTLHGTSISASDSADSYKMKAPGDGEYRFGVDGGWLLAPTRHGAHNWEGPGLETALAALHALPSVASSLAAAKPNLGRVLVAGHSMGGHGAWLLAGRLRDVAVGVVSSASWLRKDQYSESNKVLLHDIASLDVEPALAELLRAAESEYNAEALAPMLAGGLRVLIRVGTKDQTVHPWYSRRMLRGLLASGAEPAEVALVEVPGKEHWWWDTRISNDGGVVNDEQMRGFFRDCFAQPSGVAGLPVAWRLVVHNPAEGGSKGGLSVLQQLIPHRRSEVSVHSAPEINEAVPGPLLHVETSNVRRLRWRSPDLRSLACRGRGATCGGSLLLDGQPFEVPHSEQSSSVVEWCQADGRWALCGGSSALERGPATWGPMRRLFAAAACAIFGDEDSIALQASLYVADLLVMTGHGQLPLLAASSVLGADGSLAPPEACQSLLVVGTPSTNPAVANLLQHREDIGYEPPLQVSDSPVASSGISLDGCHWAGRGLAALALLPWWRKGEASALPEQRLALLATGVSPSAVAEALSLLATPTIPPMTRQPLTHLLPDYVVLDAASTRARGAGGFLAAGFWSHRWRREPRASWEAACRPAAGAAAWAATGGGEVAPAREEL